MQKGHKRSGKLVAVLHFFLGLVVVAMLVGGLYFFLQKIDYSDQLADPEATMRPYVEMTQQPQATPISMGSNSQGFGDMNPASTDNGLVDLTATSTPSPTPIPTPTPTLEPTPIPTPTPEPTPTPTPTPEPTKIPAKKLSSYRRSGFNVPSPSTNATIGLTNIYISEPNKNAYVQFNGYGYIDDASFDGATAQIFLIVTQQETGKQIAYRATMTPGISGEEHVGAQCKNAANTDFDVVLSVSKFPDGVYDLGIVLYYDRNGSAAYSYHEFGESITVKDGAASIGQTQDAFSSGNAGTTASAQPSAEPTASVDAFGAPLDGSSIG